jgi:diphthamide biosynthesis methyltransferase
MCVGKSVSKKKINCFKKQPKKTIALSAFMLTTLPTPMAQRALVEEMWASGAHTIILIDHDTTEGFKAIAHAREHILEMSRLETVDSEITSPVVVMRLPR